MVAPLFEGSWWMPADHSEQLGHLVNLVVGSGALLNCGLAARPQFMRPWLPWEPKCAECVDGTRHERRQ